MAQLVTTRVGNCGSSSLDLSQLDGMRLPVMLSVYHQRLPLLAGTTDVVIASGLPILHATAVLCLATSFLPSLVLACQPIQ
jgi:hypothetical protein